MMMMMTRLLRMIKIYSFIYLILIFRQGDSLSPIILVFDEALLNIIRNNSLK